MKTILVILALVSAGVGQQVPQFPIKINVCVETIKAYGSHVRFTTEEHLQILLNERISTQSQELPYRLWKSASRSINWFDGEKPVSLKYVKSHMPRAMLLELKFPADQNPRMVQEDVDRLLDAERKYNESTKVADAGRTYLLGLLKHYGVGPNVLFDEDMGGATPRIVLREIRRKGTAV